MFNGYRSYNIVRYQLGFYVTKVEDRFGNEVNYAYDSDLRLERIEANDGRRIDLTYQSGTDRIASVSAHGRTWSYGYGSGGLTTVTLPDNRSWSFSTGPMVWSPEPGRNCSVADLSGSVSLTHPSGVTGTFDLKETAHWRKHSSTKPQNIGGKCDEQEAYSSAYFAAGGNPPTSTSSSAYGLVLPKEPTSLPGDPPEIPPLPFPTTTPAFGGQADHVFIESTGSGSGNRQFIDVSYLIPYDHPFFETMAITKKTLSGPGYPTADWTWTYEGWNGQTWNTSGGSEKWTKMVEPSGAETTWYHNRVEGDLENTLARMEFRASVGGALLRETQYSYDLGPVVTGWRSHGVYEQHTPNPSRQDRARNPSSTVLIQDGVTHTNTATYDVYSNMLSSSSTASTHSDTRTSVYTYLNDTALWALGLTRTATHNNKLFDELHYNALRQVQYHDAFGVRAREYQYHSDGTLSYSKTPLGYETFLTNYKRGKPQNITRPDGVAISQVIDDLGQITSITDGRGKTYAYEYNNVGWLTKVVPPKDDGYAVDTVIAYTIPQDANGNVQGIVETITHDDLSTVKTYDSMQRLVAEQRTDVNDSSAVSFRSFSYDYKNRPTYESLPEATLTLSQAHGVETDYDKLGRVTEIRQIMAPLATTTFEYLTGNKIRVTDPRNNITTTSYQSFGAPLMGAPDEDNRDILPVLIEPPLGANLAIEYDIWGNTRFERQMSGTTQLAATEYVYNSRNFLQSVIDPAGDATQTFYDAQDRPIVERDGANRTVRTVYDSMDRVTKLIKAWSGDTAGTGQLDCLTMRNNYNSATGVLQHCYQHFNYDQNGNIDWVEDAAGNRTTYTYDSLNRQKRVLFPDSSYTEVQAYDGFANPLTTRMRGGHIHTAVYDALGRMRGMRTPERDSAYAYDAADRRTCASVFSTNTLNLSGTMDCLNTSTNRQHRTSYAFDAAGRMLSETALLEGAASRTTSYQYDAMDNRTRITWPDAYFAQYDYDALARLTDVKENGSAILAHYDYDAQSRLSAITYGGNNYAGGSGTSQTAFTWQIDSDLDLLTHRFTGSDHVSFDYAYDGSGKLVSETSSQSGWLYAASASQTDSYGAANNLNQYTSVNGLTVAHDQNGNRTSFDGLSTPHDSENRLTGIGTGLTYRYDADGRRTARVDGSGTTQFVHAGDMEIAEYSGATLMQRYVPGHSVDQRVAWRNISAGTLHYYHANRLGSVQAMVSSATGAVTDQYVYTPYGIETPLNTTGNPFRYTGRRLDPESGLYFYRARYYDPQHGRFLQTDPIGYKDQMNLYAYVGNDPLGAIDPSGMDSWSNLKGLFQATFNWNKSNPTHVCGVNCQAVRDSVPAGLDALQSGLDAGGFAGPYGPIADVANAGISMVRGDFGGAALNGIAAFPVVGDYIKGAKMADDAVDLFRVVDDTELADIVDKRAFRTAPGSFEGKQFVDNLGDAQALQRRFTEFFGGNQTIVHGTAPRSVVDSANRTPFADIPNGQAITVSPEQLPAVRPSCTVDCK